MFFVQKEGLVGRQSTNSRTAKTGRLIVENVYKDESAVFSSLNFLQ